jgi:hypothetical protein
MMAGSITYDVTDVSAVESTVEERTICDVPGRFGGEPAWDGRMLLVCGWPVNFDAFMHAYIGDSDSAFRNVVILCKERLDLDRQEALARFDSVYFVRGSASWRPDLVRAGLAMASSVVVFALGNQVCIPCPTHYYVSPV